MHLLKCVYFSFHLKLKSLTQFPVLNDKKYFYFRKEDIFQNLNDFINWSFFYHIVLYHFQCHYIHLINGMEMYKV